MATVADVNTHLKNNLEVSEKLRQRRKEIKAALNKDGLPETEEVRLAKELFSVGEALSKLETDRESLYESLKAAK